MSNSFSDNTSDPNSELLRSIAASLKGIHSSLEHLTGAVEGVAESIEIAHEPEGDLGVHLVAALKDLTLSLHKRAQQERSFQPQHQQRPQHQNRRDDRPQRQDREEDFHQSQRGEEHRSEDHPALPEDSERPDEDQIEFQAVYESPEQIRPPSDTNAPKEANKRPRPNRRRRPGGSQGKQPTVNK